MRMRRTIFLLSVLLHLIALYWIAGVRMPAFFYPKKERVINIVPISVPPLAAVSSPQKGLAGGQSTGTGKKITPGSETPAKIIGSPAGTTYPQNRVQDEGIPGKPKLTAPPLDVKKIPELSIYSEDMQDLLRNFERGRTSRSTGETVPGAGIGDIGGGGGGAGTGEGGLTAGKSRAFFNTGDYDLSPWAKQVLLRIQNNWLIPPTAKNEIQRPVEIIAVIEKNGGISLINVKISSNSDAFDRAARNALLLSAPLPGLPRDFPEKNLEARFMFASSETAARPP